jgi:hypothetical protein
MEIRYLITIIVYNKKLNESSTISSLSKLNLDIKGHSRVIVWDNSQERIESNSKENLSLLLDGIDSKYLFNNGKNVPLSIIYNHSIKLLNNYEYLVILDDDSEFNSEMFEKANQAITINPSIDLFLPIVMFNNTIVSPAYMWYFKGHFLKHVNNGIMKCKHITAINSGMIIKGDYLKNRFKGYDERITLYGTDNDFMSQYDDTHDHLYVIDYKMRHTLDFYSKEETFEKKSRRYINQRKALLIIMRRKGLLIYLLTHIYYIAFSIKFAIIHKDIRYLFIH